MDRALAVLRLVVLESRPILLDEIAARIGLHKSVTYRLLRSLENAGFVRRDPTQGGYAVAAGFLSLSVMTANRTDLRRTTRPAMEAIVALCGETVSLHVRSGDQRVCVDVADGIHSIRRVIPVGETLPLYAGETGRVLMSDLPQAEFAGLLEAAAEAGLDVERLRSDLLRVREHGYFIGIGERTPDVGSASFALRGSLGVMGALTVSGPASRWNRAAIKAALPSILDALRPVTTALGGGAATARAV